MEQRTSGNDDGLSALHARYQMAAWTLGIDWELSEGDFRRLAQEPCHFCSTPPAVRRDGAAWGCGDLPYSEVGQADNSAGFNPENCLPCCEYCHRVKASSTCEETAAWVARLAAHNAPRGLRTPAEVFGARDQPSSPLA